MIWTNKLTFELYYTMSGKTCQSIKTLVCGVIQAVYSSEKVKEMGILRIIVILSSSLATSWSLTIKIYFQTVVDDLRLFKLALLPNTDVIVTADNVSPFWQVFVQIGRSKIAVSLLLSHGHQHLYTKYLWMNCNIHIKV